MPDPEDGESVETGHADVEKDDVRFVGANQLDGLDAVGPLGDDRDVACGAQQIQQLLPGQRFIVDDECSQ